MDGPRFDRWTKLRGASSRRGVLRSAVGSGLAGFGLSGGQAVALACRKNGTPCGAGRNGGCCSGTCKKGRCRPTKGAAGCTVPRDVCKRPQDPCPNNENGLCILLDSGKPYCFKEIDCVNCKSDAECTRLRDGVPGKCVKTCNACSPTSNHRACVYRQPLPN